MSDLGDLFGGIGEFFSGLAEAGGERAAEGVAAAFAEKAMGGGDDEVYADVALDRYLTGGPRVLNVNDL
jgi:hypothetical protein